MRLEHIGIVVKSIEARKDFWGNILGLKFVESKEVSPQKVRVAVFDAGGVKIELIEPMSKDSPISKFLEKRGEGIHHLCFEVENIEKAISLYKTHGLAPIGELPYKGAFAKKVIFLHPKTTHGILIELCEK